MANPMHTGNTKTSLVASPKQARDLAKKLVAAANKAEKEDECQHIDAVLRQVQYEGPWELTIHVVK